MDEQGRGVQEDAMERAPARIDEVPEERLIRAIRERFPESSSGFEHLRAGVVRAVTSRDELFDTCKFLKDSLGFEHISMISAVEYDDRFEIVYHITSYQNRLLMELITRAPKDDPSVDSVSSIWGGANWQERASYDLMGIIFNNHPNLERILLPKDYVYHPLRKEFKG